MWRKKERREEVKTIVKESFGKTKQKNKKEDLRSIPV
jgi:hypothetical protein